MAKEKVNVGKGQQKDGELIEVTNSNEPWATYELADGTIIKLKLVLSEIWRIDNEYDADGNPLYFFKASPMHSVRSPDTIKRKLQ